MLTYNQRCGIMKKQKILSGVCKDNYVMPEQSVQKEFVKSIMEEFL